MTLPVLEPSSAALQEALQELDSLTHRAVGTVLHRPGETQHPGEGDELELAQVAEVVPGRQTLFTGPTLGFVQPPLRDESAPSARRWAPDDGKVVTHILAR